MQEHHFKVLAPFASVADVLASTDGIAVLEASELHRLCTLAGGAVVIVRPAYPDAVDVVVAEADEVADTVAHDLADRLAGLLGCEVSEPQPMGAA